MHTNGRRSFIILVIAMGRCMRIITGSTVVLTCCKGDCQSQWKTPIFGPSQLGNPFDFDKIWNRWLRRRRDPSCQTCFCTFSGGASPYRWNQCKGAYGVLHTVGSNTVIFAVALTLCFKLISFLHWFLLFLSINNVTVMNLRFLYFSVCLKSVQFFFKI